MLASTSHFAQCCHSCGGASQERGFGSSKTTICSGKRPIKESPLQLSMTFPPELGSRTWLLLSPCRGLCAPRLGQPGPGQVPTSTSPIHHRQSLPSSLNHPLPVGVRHRSPTPPFGLDFLGLSSRFCNAQVRNIYIIYNCLSNCLSLQYFFKQTCCY